MSLVKTSFYDTDITANNTEIDYMMLAEHAKPLEQVYVAVMEYLSNELNIEQYIIRKRVNIKEIDPLISNKLMYFLFQKYKNDSVLTKVDLFAAVTEVLDMEPDKFYADLTDKIKLELKESLNENLGYEVDYDLDRDKMDKLGVVQVKI